MWDRCAVHMLLRRTHRIPTSSPARKISDARHICSKICAVKCLRTGPKAFEIREIIGFGKIPFWYFVAEHCRGSLLFLIAGSVGNFASMIQVTHISKSVHSAVDHRSLQEYLFPFKTEGEDGSTVPFTGCTNFARPLTSVPELTAVRYGAARLTLWIKNTSRPWPHIDEARSRLGISLYGAAVMLLGGDSLS